MKNNLIGRSGVTAAQFGVTLGVLGLMSFGASLASAATLTRSIDVNGSVSAVWSAIGPFCAIKDWLPPVGKCTEDGGVPPTRTLVTKDGQATFVEIQTARSEADHRYSYAFKSSPLPVKQYNSTIQVTAKGAGTSTVTWSAIYTPEPGKEKDVSTTLDGIYEAGLGAIKAKFEN
jgi:hypothetical protein